MSSPGNVKVLQKKYKKFERGGDVSCLKKFNMFVGARIREHRLKSNLTLEDLSEKLEFSMQQFQKYEQGTTRVSVAVLFQLMKIFQVPIDYFYKGFEELYKDQIVSERINPLTIFLMESDPADRIILRDIILSFDSIVNVCILDHEKQLIDFLKNRTRSHPFPRPDIVFMGLGSPEFNALRVLKEIKRDQSIQDIPVIIFSHSRKRKNLLQSYKGYSSGYI